MKKSIKFFMSILLFAGASSIIYYGCKKKDSNSSSSTTTATCSDGIQNQGETGVDCGGPCPACAVASMSAKVDGNQWTANFVTANNMSGTLAIQGSYTPTTQGIDLSYSGTFAVGTYTLGSLDGNYAVSTPSTVNCIIQTGTITFTTFNTTTKTVSGTFSFSCTDATTHVSQSITNGVFSNVKYN